MCTRFTFLRAGDQGVCSFKKRYEINYIITFLKVYINKK